MASDTRSVSSEAPVSPEAYHGLASIHVRATTQHCMMRCVRGRVACCIHDSDVCGAGALQARCTRRSRARRETPSWSR
jgi:hypothetical protein